jgi:Subtilase family
MTWFFQPHPGGGASGQHDDDSAPGLTSLPAALLQRHGARALDPATAASVPGFPAPRPTVYRARTLLIPDELIDTDPVTGALAGVKMKLVRTGQFSDLENGDRKKYGEVIDELRRLPRPAVLAPADDNVPVVVDAWVALQALRAAARPRPGRKRDGAKPDQVIAEADIRRISLEHLLISSPPPPPITNGGGGLNGTTDSSGSGAPTSTSSYVYRGDTRTPVAVCAAAPPREPVRTFRSRYGRRPVVAVLDTGVRAHPWLDVWKKPKGGGYKTEPPGGDGFVVLDQDIQDAIAAQGNLLEKGDDRARQVIRNAWDRHVTLDPLVGELDSDIGHGTFVAGIVRQVAPDARVLAIRVMHSDGVIYEGDLLCALEQLALRIAQAEKGNPRQMVDVISLSLGYFDETPAEATFSSGLWQAIKVLLGLGVVIVAAAGNYSTSRKFYPAAFAQPPDPAGPVPVVSVGALNPNGSKAVFSDGGDWITAWAWGAAMVSTFPTDINGSCGPELRLPAHPGNAMPPGISLPAEREALDPDDYSAGFALWSGTSFSAPLVAAHIARALVKGKTDKELGLNLSGSAAAARRSLAALRALGWDG